jgi:hypothetical protein
VLLRLAGLVRVIRVNMNQPNATESALRNGSGREFGPLIRVKVGVAVRQKRLGSSPDLPSGLSGLGHWEDLARTASR